MKIKRDAESMREVRAILARSPGWYPKAQLDELSDDELADALERSFTALKRGMPQLQEAMRAMGAALTRATSSWRAVSAASWPPSNP